MMILCALYDKKAQTYSPCVAYPDIATAQRSFVGLLASGDSIPSQYPEDFDLYELGTFNSSDGAILPVAVPRQILTGLQAEASLHDLLRRRKGGAVGETAVAVSPEDKAKPDGSSPIFESASYKATPDLI